MNVRFYYPGFTYKAVSFTIDDGNLRMDKKFIDIVKPHGIVGTFNLCSHSMSGMSAEEYREFYQGFEIANHVKGHPFVIPDNMNPVISDEEFNEATADETKLYRCKRDPNYYHIKKPNGWRLICDADFYIRMCDEGFEDLIRVFGEGKVRSFVWPYGQQYSSKVFEHLKSFGYYGIRKTGCVDDSTGFAPPSDWFAWSYNANNVNLLEIMEKYENYPDDGSLKFFSFGVHSVDFERSENWCDLETFAEKYGDRPDAYWYASIGDIYDYLSATKNAVISDGVIENTSDVAIYLELSGERIVLSPKEKRSI